MTTDEIMDCLTAFKIPKSFGLDTDYGAILTIEQATAIRDKLRAAEELATAVEISASSDQYLRKWAKAYRYAGKGEG